MLITTRLCHSRDLRALKLPEGQLAYATDTEELYIGSRDPEQPRLVGGGPLRLTESTIAELNSDDLGSGELFVGQFGSDVYDAFGQAIGEVYYLGDPQGQLREVDFGPGFD